MCMSFTWKKCNHLRRWTQTSRLFLSTGYKTLLPFLLWTHNGTQMPCNQVVSTIWEFQLVSLTDETIIVRLVCVLIMGFSWNCFIPFLFDIMFLWVSIQPPTLLNHLQESNSENKEMKGKKLTATSALQSVAIAQAKIYLQSYGLTRPNKLSLIFLAVFFEFSNSRFVCKLQRP